MSHTDDMSRLARELRESYDSRVAAVSELQAATGQQLTELHAQHCALATAQREELAQFAQLLQRDVANLQHDLQVARAARSADQRRQLEAYTYDLRHNTASLLAHHTAARNTERERQRQQLSTSIEALRTATQACLDEAHQARMALHTDHAEAHQAWGKFTEEMRQQRAEHRQTDRAHH